MEVLACNVHAPLFAQGITLPGVITRLPVFSLYADDVSVIVSSDRAMEEVFHMYSRFEKGTGSKLNLDKCEGLWLGGWRGPPDSPVPFHMTSNWNWCPCVDEVPKCVLAWSSRHLSYGGRALISNALALARVWYMATLLPGPALVKLNRIIFPFF